jgi:hypothetical protein
MSNTEMLKKSGESGGQTIELDVDKKHGVEKDRSGNRTVWVGKNNQSVKGVICIEPNMTAHQLPLDEVVNAPMYIHRGVL